MKTKLRDAHDGKDGTLRDLLGQILSKESKEESHNNQNQNNGASHTNQQKQNTDSVNQEIDPETLKKILTDERFNHQK